MLDFRFHNHTELIFGKKVEDQVGKEVKKYSNRILLHYDGDVWDLFDGKSIIKDTLPLGVILTLPGTGSEASNGTVITKEDVLLKKSFCHNMIRPRFALLNPEFTYTLPNY